MKQRTGAKPSLDLERFNRERSRWPLLSQGQRYLYFIMLLEGVKIGVSFCPATRRRTLRACTWREPEILVALPCHRFGAESAIHKYLAGAALGREWFALEHPQVMTTIALAHGCADAAELLHHMQTRWAPRHGQIASCAQGVSQ